MGWHYRVIDLIQVGTQENLNLESLFTGVE